MNFFYQTNTKYRIKKGRCDVMTIFIECIYKFFENPNNLAEFEKWKEAKASKVKEKENEHMRRILTNG